MKNKILAMLMAAYLIAGCSSGAGTSGAGGAGAVTAGSFLITASLSSGDSISVDTIQNLCVDETGMVTGVEPGLTTKTGLFTVTITNIADLTGGIFATGVILTTYTVTFVGTSTGAPGLAIQTFGETTTITSDSSATFTVILLDLGSTLPEFASKNPSGTVHSYRVTVNMRGSTLSGDDFVVSATTFLEAGNFDRCASSTDDMM